MKCDIVVDTSFAWDSVFRTNPEEVNVIYVLVKNGRSVKIDVNSETIAHVKKIKYVKIPPFPRNTHMLCAYIIGILSPSSDDYVSLLPGMIQNMMSSPRDLYVMTRNVNQWSPKLFGDIYERTFIRDPTDIDSDDSEDSLTCESGDSSSEED